MRSTLVAVVLVVGWVAACSSGTTPGASETSVGPGERVFVVRGENMYPTLHGCSPPGPNCHDDHVVFDLLAGKAHEVRGGDIIVFRAPRAWIEGEGITTLVSRVIAVGGQTVKGVANGRVMLSDNGKDGPYRLLQEPYVFIDRGQRGSVRRFGPVTVPKNRLWLMGDHRNDSADSRYHCGVGGTDAISDANCNSLTSTIPVTRVIGIADRIIVPPDHVASLK